MALALRREVFRRQPQVGLGVDAGALDGGAGVAHDAQHRGVLRQRVDDDGVDAAVARAQHRVVEQPGAEAATTAAHVHRHAELGRAGPPGLGVDRGFVGEVGQGQQVEAAVEHAEDLVALPYSSGTTGLPKGVMLTHRNLVANIKQMEGLDYFFETDTLICVLPLFHIYGLVVVLNMGLYTGATIVTMPRFELEAFLKTAQDYNVSLAHLVPPIVLGLSKHPIVDEYQLPKLRTIFSGAAPLGEELTRACMDRLGCQIRQGYGMTETSPVTHSSPAPPFNIKFGSVGVCAPSTECRIVSLETGEDLPPMERGEVCVRGPQIMLGYLNKPEATASTIDEDGWLHTGDIGYADHDGHFFIVDRAKELIKYKGFQVPPAELEAVLLTHPCVADAAVIPCRDDEAGEVPKAILVLKTETTEAEILDFVSERVAPYKRIRYVEFIEQIPKSPSGKILRRVLVEKERSKTAAT